MSDVSRFSEPLASRVRPLSVGEVVGAEALLRPGAPLYRLLTDVSASASVVLWGPPGTGKTTLATLAGEVPGRRFVQVSAVSSGVKQLREVIDEAKKFLDQGVVTVLFIDEVHRFSKTQQDVLLPAVESGWVNLVAATTENPSVSMVSALLSRLIVLRLSLLSDEQMEVVVDRALGHPDGLPAVELTAEGRDLLVRFSLGDARRCLTALEMSAASASSLVSSDGPVVVTADVVRDVLPYAVARFDRSGDSHYDLISALIKSVRGSDVDAALHYLARLVESGEDSKFIARRLVILASEDIGLADHTALPLASAALGVVGQVGWPEAGLVLAQVVVHLCLSPKSNAVYAAFNAAVADVRQGRYSPVPDMLRDASLASSRATGAGEGYLYPHDYDGFVPVRCVDEPVASKHYYNPSDRGSESRAAAAVARLRQSFEQGQADS